MTTEILTTCYHCGEDCDKEEIQLEEKTFCCEGCKMVFEVLNENDMCTYYNLENTAGVSLKARKEVSDYAVLDDEEVQRQLIDFENDEIIKVTFYMPQIHCAACIWLLENLYKLHKGVAQSKVNFLKKETYITFNKKETSLREVVRLLASIGYAPEINLNDLSDDDKKQNTSKVFFYKLGVAGFCFGNIMLLSFPEYLGLNTTLESDFATFFNYLNVVLALPVLLYSGTDYFKSAWYSVQQKRPNIDIPIALGISVLFLRSVFEIFSQTGTGYLDSMAGLVFFLLIGKWFQQKTYDTITFERDYKSYFPISAIKRTENGELETVALTKLKKGDTIIVKNQALIPSDAMLIKGRANIDYSFVTGEAEPIRKKVGEMIYAGGRQVGDSIEVTLTKAVSQSYLTQLWNDEAFTKPSSNFTLTIDRVGERFTIAILVVAFATGIYWLFTDPSVAMNAFTAVLIIACPCALALNIPFALGNVLRILGKNKFYIKSTDVIERMAKITDLVFDKTGTLTSSSNNELVYEGTELTSEEQFLVNALAGKSSHPISQEIARTVDDGRLTVASLDGKSTSNFREIIGQGVSAIINENSVRIGSEGFIFNMEINNSRGTFIEINGVVKGFFTVKNKYRFGIEKLMRSLQNHFNLSLLSGDNDREKTNLSSMFLSQQLYFNQKPEDKLNFIKNYQKEGKKVMMLGDGLNDAGALKQSEIGIAISENLNHFSPACDAILDAEKLPQLDKYLAFAKSSMTLVYIGFALSLIYNVIGLSFAVQGLLEPVIAAILMPLSSVTIVVFGMVSTSLLAKRFGF